MRLVSARLYFLPVETRVPLKFGSETLTRVTCARVRVEVEGKAGALAEGWGEVPLSVQWVWPSGLAYDFREGRLRAFCGVVLESWMKSGLAGHPLEVGWDYQQLVLPGELERFNAGLESEERMPYLAALLCCAALDQALHDAFGRLHGCSTYALYGRDVMSRDLGAMLEAAEGAGVDFGGCWPADYLVRDVPVRLPVWHLVGGLDPIGRGELTGGEPRDGYPVLLEDWVRRDGLKCLKVKLRGNDEEWDFARLVAVGELGRGLGVEWLSADFNCTVRDPAYVNAVLDRCRADHPEVYGMILYVEQPFPYELEEGRIDVRSIVERKPLFLDESAHDWRVVRLGRELGWNGVALKTCKTQTGAILSACWAKAHGMQLMVQDLTNPMLAQIPHVLLAARVGTVMGVESNGMQFYPDASLPEAAVHPGLYARRGGELDLSSLGGVGFGYREGEIVRELPAAALAL